MAKRARTATGGNDRSMTATMEAALRRHVRAKGADYLKDPNINSVGIGFKNGDGPISLQFSVRRKVDDSVVETVSNWPIPKTIKVEGMEVPTDVIEREFEPSFKIVQLEAMDQRRLRCDPIRPGMSCGHIDVSAGTIGLIVFDRTSGAPCILSNWHVLQGGTGKVGDSIVQPGTSDDNNIAGNLAGELLRSHLGPPGDCALARIRTRGFDRSVFDLDVTPKRMARVALGDTVIKSGRTTDITHGLVRRIDVMVKIVYEGLVEPQIIGCFEIGVDPTHPPVDGEISMGGDSGSAWLIAENGKATNIFAGLHFAGESGINPDEHALACYAASVQKKLDFVLEPPATGIMEDDAPEAAVPRMGYDPAFLGVAVPMPGLSLSLKRDAVNFGREQVIPYTHFSVCLSARRKLARFVAWNIDGARQVKLPRREFKLDPRIDARLQTGEDLYAGNALDRGHIARRADVCWGPVEEADQANRDSFFFTNIAPQHERFNQSGRAGLWGELENLVFEQTDVQDIRVSVMSGPVFADADPAYRGILLPESFWKLIAYLGSDGALRVLAFVLEQADFLTDLETLDLDPFRLFQIDLDSLKERTELDYSGLNAADVARHPELSTRPEARDNVRIESARGTEIRTVADLRL